MFDANVSMDIIVTPIRAAVSKNTFVRNQHSAELMRCGMHVAAVAVNQNALYPLQKTIPYVLQLVLLAVNVNLDILVILMAHVWQKISVTLVALIKPSNHVEVIAVNQLVECQIVPIGTAIILALQDANVMLDMFVTF
jgi:hypothetical protein